jgi:hypothetical protein
MNRDIEETKEANEIKAAFEAASQPANSILESFDSCCVAFGSEETSIAGAFVALDGSCRPIEGREEVFNEAFSKIMNRLCRLSKVETSRVQAAALYLSSQRKVK